MRRLTLTEYQRSPLPGVCGEDAAAIARAVPSLRVEPSLTLPGGFDATPGPTVGVVSLGNLEVEIRPKIPIDRLLFMISYAVDPDCWFDDPVRLGADCGVLEAVAPALVRMVARATGRGLLHGYRSEEDALPTVRGQVRFADQVRERFGLLPPVEVRFDDFTVDVEENRRLRAAIERLGRLRLRAPRVARSLREVGSLFREVRTSEYDPRRIDPVPITRLNSHYGPPLRLADIILRACSLEVGARHEPGTAFLLNMNDVFEMFVHRALCEALGVSDANFRRGDPSLRLDDARRVRLEPDLSWWIGSKCAFVGDVKYKRLAGGDAQNADIYQALAYAIASGLPEVMLIYAKGEAEPAEYFVPAAGKLIRVVALDLADSPSGLLSQVGRIASQAAQRARRGWPGAAGSGPILPSTVAIGGL